MTTSLAFLIAALVLFIIAALFFFGIGNISLGTELGLVAVGAACSAASRLPLP